jgi:hypothetical protein
MAKALREKLASADWVADEVQEVNSGIARQPQGCASDDHDAGRAESTRISRERNEDISEGHPGFVRQSVS